jgi:hypothetical protein
MIPKLPGVGLVLSTSILASIDLEQRLAPLHDINLMQ